jgi:lactoylglutathione lyase
MNINIQINLIVIRSVDIERSVNFYQLLGLTFLKHRHGKGLEHFASTLGNVTFEIYPQTPKAGTTVGTRLGFQVMDLNVLMNTLSQADIAILTQPTDSEWGRRAVIADPDGHKIELIQIPPIHNLQ